MCGSHEQCGDGGKCFDASALAGSALKLCGWPCEDYSDCRWRENYLCYYTGKPDEIKVCLPIFGSISAGSEQEPGVYMDGVHHLMKTVAGVTNLRPAWFFDVDQQGEGLADTGTHLVDLVQWMLFPEQAIDYRKDIKVIGAKRWPTVIDKAQFRKVTGEPDFPPNLSPNIRQDRLDLYCNGLVSYALRGVHVKVRVGWNYEKLSRARETRISLCSREARQGSRSVRARRRNIGPNSM